ncbi:MSCRAMM family protein, partial [Enterococcus mundtii]
MISKKINIFIYGILSILLVVSQLGLVEVFSEDNLQTMKTGDDPGISINIPETIVARQQVEINVSMVSSAGNITEDGEINVTIPQSIVADETELVNRLVLGAPFYLGESPVTKNGNGDYVLQVLYDHTLINQQDAVGLTFTIKFTAPVFDASDPNIPETANISAEMYQGNDLTSQDSATSMIKGINNDLTPLTKLSIRPVKYIEGQKCSIMSLTDPSSNVFAITVNYNSKNLKDVKLIDETPEGTQLTDPDNYVPCSGDKTPFNHIRIAKVTSRMEDGTPNAWQYVTSEFKEKVSIDASGFTIDFGDLTSADSYIVMYGEEIAEDATPETFGIRNNHCEMYSGNSLIQDYDVRLALDESSFNGISLNKKVEQSTLSVTEGELDYTLTLKNSSGVVPAGTIISDPLPQFTTYQSTVSKDDAVVSDATYDKETNTLKYTLKKDLTYGQSTNISFSVLFNNPTAKPGEKIENKASFNYKGTDIYSNMATTILDGSAYLTKIDNDTKNPLAGAQFKIVDDSGETVLENLISDNNGRVNTGLMKPGNYQFIETEAPNNYILDTKPVDFTVSPGITTPIQLIKTNTISGSVTLTKTDEDTGETLPGAVFELQTNQGKNVQKGLTTDKTGKLSVKDLAPGEYQFIETKAP